MRNVWKVSESVDGKEVEKVVSIPPTLMFSVRAKISDVKKLVTMDVKNTGDLVYVVGETFNETGGSEYYRHMGEKMEGQAYVGQKVPKIYLNKAKEIYNKISEATEKRLANSIHTPTLGGLGVAFAFTSLAGGLGLEVDLRRVPRSGIERDDILLFSESNSRFIVTVSTDRKREFEKVMSGVKFARVGTVTSSPNLKIKGLNGSCIIDSDIRRLKGIWKKTLEGI
jgi:phosphoribosylformylglycinamidine synthase